MWHTRLTKEYGIEFPFVSAGMSSLAMPELVAAVSNAGGLGLLGASPLPPPAMQSLIQATKSLTSRPFGVDFVIAATADRIVRTSIFGAEWPNQPVRLIM